MFASALRETLAEGYTSRSFRGDLTAGLTVGIVSLPLSMALAIAVGVPPQHGLYTALIAGAIIALCGGSRVNISGPTAAFVVILLPITHQYGLGGLLIAGFLSGLILVALGLARMGRLIELVPYPVTVGFTSGIATVIVLLQVKDFFGLETGELDPHFIEKLAMIASALPTMRWEDTAIALLTLALLVLWPRLKTRLPAALVALAVATLAAWAAMRWLPGFTVATVGNTFSYSIGDLVGQGIPPAVPHFVWPWELPGPDGEAVGLSFRLVSSLLGAAMAIAALAAIESLLCAVIADGMAGRRHDPNAELIGQGIGNLCVPFFGGIPATAAISRTAVSIRNGAVSPFAAVIHSVVILVSLLALAGLLGHIPMAALAALLVIVAWHMAEARHFLRIVRTAPGSDVAVLIACFTLTVVFDMTVAVAVGIALSSMLFIRQLALRTEVSLVQPASLREHETPAGVAIYDINGALFFGAAHKAMRTLEALPRDVRVVVLDMTDVSLLDMTAMWLLNELIAKFGRNGVSVIISGLNPRMVLKLRRVGIRKHIGRMEFTRSVSDALVRAQTITAA